MTQKRPTYGRPIREVGDVPRLQSSAYAFAFSDDINVWIGKHKERREKNRITYQKNKAFKLKMDTL